MNIVDGAINFIPNVLKRSMYFGHQLGDVVLPRLLQKVGFSPVASELTALPFTALGAAGALWVGGSNAITPMFGVLASIFNPMGLLVFAPVALVFAAVTCVGIGMGDVVLKKFGKTPIFDGIYDNMSYRSERKVKLADKADKAAKAQAAADLELQRKLDAEKATPAAAAKLDTPQGTQPFAGTDPAQPSIAGVRNAAGAFNTSADGSVPKFAGFPPTVDTDQGPRERPERPARPDKP